MDAPGADPCVPPSSIFGKHACCCTSKCKCQGQWNASRHHFARVRRWDGVGVGGGAALEGEGAHVRVATRVTPVGCGSGGSWSWVDAVGAQLTAIFWGGSRVGLRERGHPSAATSAPDAQTSTFRRRCRRCGVSRPSARPSRGACAVPSRASPVQSPRPSPNRPSVRPSRRTCGT